jgi:hypothetical protein
MTILGTRAAGRARDMFDLRPGGPAADDLVVQLRESAGRMVPFSQPKILLRAAASAIERLDTDARNLAADVRRLTAELQVLRGASGSS